MARKVDTSNFNEAAVVELMGGMPSQRSVPAAQSGVPAPSEPQTDVIIEKKAEETKKELPVKRKEDGKTYDEIFLDNIPIRLRVSMALDVEVIDKLNFIARVVFNNQVPVSVLVNNILLHHIEEYKEEFVRRMNANKSVGDFLYSK